MMLRNIIHNYFYENFPLSRVEYRCVAITTGECHIEFRIDNPDKTTDLNGLTSLLKKVLLDFNLMSHSAAYASTTLLGMTVDLDISIEHPDARKCDVNRILSLI